MGSIEVGYGERAYVQAHAAEVVREFLHDGLTFEEIAVYMGPHMNGVVPRARTIEGWAQEVATPNRAHGAALAQFYRGHFGKPFIDQDGLTKKANEVLSEKG